VEMILDIQHVLTKQPINLPIKYLQLISPIFDRPKSVNLM